MRRTIIPALLAALFAACTTQPVAEPKDPGGAKVEAAARAIALETFEDCARLETYLQTESRALADTAGWYGIGGPMGFGERTSDVAGRSSGGEKAPVPSTADAGSYSTTNVQEKDVDEPDSVKTDGRTLYTVVGNRLVAVALGGGVPTIAGTYTTTTFVGGDLLLAGDRLLLLSSGGGYGIAEGGIAVDRMGARAVSGRSVPPGWRQDTQITVLDVSDPSAIRLVRTVSLEGSIVSARMVAGVARIVLRTSGAAIELTYPQDGSLASRRTAERKNRKALAALDLEDWLPKASLAGPGVTVEEQKPSPIVPCERVRRPKTFSGLDMVSVVSLDPEDPKPADAATVVGAGDTVYASTTSLYVATNTWNAVRPMAGDRPAVGGEITTTIHRFDISDPTRARYTSSGTVPGHVLNQWSLSEHDGALRVATTLDLSGSIEGATESQVTVLRERGSLLARIGRVTGLGKDERIYGVRFIGDLGYVVTFRQVDPLYVLDLSDPTKPVVRGELKISGYSAYLHPVDDGRLLGIGADADTQGRRLGAQATVFDVSDPDAPRALDRQRFKGGSTNLEYDHHAFLWWAPERLAAFPLTTQSADGMSYRAGIVGLTVSRAGGLSVRGRLEHPAANTGEGQPEISRALVADGTLYTLSYAGLGSADLETFRARNFLRWPA